jgi:hypothetical protein
MLEQQRAVQLAGLLGERPTLCNSHGSDVFSLPFARRLILEYRTPAAEAPFPASVSGRRWEWIQQRQFLFHICRGSTFDVQDSLVAVSSLHFFSLPCINDNQLAMNFGYFV